MRTTVLRVALAAVILLGIFFRAYHLERKVYWEDEIVGTIRALGYTEAQIVEASPSMSDAADLQKYFHLATSAMGGDRLANTVRSLAAEDPQHPPLYYVLSHVWIERFGSSVGAIRGLPALFGILALPVAYWLAFELFGSVTVALLAAALLAISPFHVLYAQEAREYSLWTLAILCCSVAFLRARRLMTISTWSIYAFLAAASLYVFPFSGLVLAGQGLALLTVHSAGRRRAFAYYATSCFVAAAAFAPWLYVMLTNAALERGLGRILTVHLSAPTIAGTLVKNLRQTFFDIGTSHTGSNALSAVNAVSTVGVALGAAYALTFVVRRANRQAASFVVFALCLPALPLLLSDLVRHGMLVAQSRYFTPLYLGVEFAVAYLLCAKLSDVRVSDWQRRAWACVTVTIIAGGFASCLASARADTWWNKDYEQSRDVAKVINDSIAPLVVERVNSSRSLGLGFYLQPSVKLAMRLSCDNCDARRIAYASRPDFGHGQERYSDVFLVGPAQALASSLTAPHSRTFPHYRAVGISVFPIAAEPLGMFRAI